MFDVSPETKAKAIQAIREILKKDGVHDKHLTDAVLTEAIDAAVKIVKAQFGF